MRGQIAPTPDRGMESQAGVEEGEEQERREKRRSAEHGLVR